MQPQLLELDANAALSAMQSVTATDGEESDAAPLQMAQQAQQLQQVQAQLTPATPAPQSELPKLAPQRCLHLTSSLSTSSLRSRAVELAALAAPAAGLAPAVSAQKLRQSRSQDIEKEKEPKVKEMTSELDLAVKRELVAKALLLARPAPLNKVSRLRWQYAAHGRAGAPR
jgi:hypothetical protein